MKKDLLPETSEDEETGDNDEHDESSSDGDSDDERGVVFDFFDFLGERAF